MEAILMYFLKMTITSGVMYLYYLTFLKDKTFHHYNRFYLVLTVLFSLLLPLLKVSYFTMEVHSSVYPIFNPIQAYSSEKQIDYDFNYYSIFMLVVGCVAFVLSIQLIFSVWKIKQLQRNSVKKNIEGIAFYNTTLENAPFSFFKNLFWRENISLDSDLGRQILKHEMVHIEQKHSYDKMLVEIVQRLFWFNPIFYWIKKELNLIHEYLADKKAVKNHDTKAFAKMLLGTHFSMEAIPMTHPFINSHLKKRLKMLQKSTTKHAYLRKLAILPVFFTMTFVLLVNAKNKEIKTINEKVKTMEHPLKKDTIREKVDINYSVRYDYKEDNGDKKMKENPYQRIVKDAKSSDIFKIEDRTVSKKEFEKFMNKHYKDKKFSISYITKDKNKDAVYRVSIKKSKMPTVNKNHKTASVEASAKLSNTKLEDHLKNMTDENALFYVNDKQVSKAKFEKFITENRGKNGFELMFSDDKTKGEKAIFSTAMNKMKDNTVKYNELHQNFINKMKEKRKKHEKETDEVIKKARKKLQIAQLKADRIILMGSDESAENQDALLVSTNSLSNKEPITEIEGAYLTEDENAKIKYILDGKELTNEEMKTLSVKTFKRIQVRSDKKVIEIFTE